MSLNRKSTDAHAQTRRAHTVCIQAVLICDCLSTESLIDAFGRQAHVDMKHASLATIDKDGKQCRGNANRVSAVGLCIRLLCSHKNAGLSWLTNKPLSRH